MSTGGTTSTPSCAHCRSVIGVKPVELSFRIGKPLQLCDACNLARQERHVRRALLAIVLALAATGVWRWWAGELPEQLISFWKSASTAGVWFGVSWVMVWFHEFAHALVAKLVGMKVLGITFGCGTRFWRWKLGNFFIDWHVIPTMGLCWAQWPPGHGARWRTALMLASGPATHVAAIIVVFASGWRWMDFDRDSTHRFLETVLFVNAIDLLVNVVPWSATWNGRTVRSDGGQILDLFRPARRSLGSDIRTLGMLADDGRPKRPAG